MKTNLKGNNKGFSLVELIVVMAIMAILAVTLTPRLTQYIDKARQTNDREIPNAVFTATRLALLDQTNQDAVTASVGDTIDWTAGVDVLATFYDHTTNAYTLKTTGLPTLDPLATEIIQTIGNRFKFQSSLANSADAATLVVTVPAATLTDGQFKVEFSYPNTTAGSYTMDTSATY